MRLSNIVAVVAVLTFSASCKKDDEKKGGTTETPATKPTDMADKPADKPAEPEKKTDWSTMKLEGAEGWEGEYNAALENWTFEKYTPGADGMNEPNRMYVGEMPDDVPMDVAGYADKLQKDKMFQDMGFLYSKVDKQEAMDAGWLIVGEVTDTNDAESKPTPGFVMMRDVGGVKVRCHSGAMTTPAVRDEAIEACKKIAW